MKHKPLSLIGLAVSLGVMGHANAALLGNLQQYPDITLGAAYLIYDHDAIQTYKNGACSSTSPSRACVGQFTLVSFDATLNSGSYPSPSATQLYGTNNPTYYDDTPDKMMAIAIQSTGSSSVLGSLANVSSSNEMTITPGDPNYNNDWFSWLGNITNFGIQEDGRAFDGFWKMTADTYHNLPAGMERFVDGALTSAMANYEGGFKISNSAGFGNVSFANALKRDWVFGSGMGDPRYTDTLKGMLAPYLTGLSTNTCSSSTATNCVSYISSTVMADVFVPIPPALLLWAGALASLVPSVKRIKNNNNLLGST
ncbi:MAG: hypothetical protein ACU836_03095 [Gammaproteobacteria bacterium]